ncbi:DUF642 domain-containing protein, partial [Chryseobacterium sp. EO14]
DGVNQFIIDNNTTGYTETGVWSTLSDVVLFGGSERLAASPYQNQTATWTFTGLTPRPIIPCDTDNDGIPNSLDLDSDGDGCPDAVEGGANFVTSNLVANALPTPVASNGIPTIAGTGQSVNFSQNATLNECTDTDNDGITDLNDLDDDNDGILDTDEMNCELVSNGTFIGNSTIGWSLSGNVIAQSNVLVFNSSETAPNAVVTQTINTKSGNFYTLSYLLGATSLSNLGMKVDVIDVVTNTVLATKSVFKNNAPNVSTEKVYFKAIGNTTRLEFTDISTVTIGVDLTLDNVSIGYCDTDNDGIPNSLDLDSDGDGCPDAVEGGANFVISNLVPSSIPGGNSGTGYSGSSTSPVQSNLCNSPACVSTATATLGVPISSGTGQSVNYSQDVMLNECTDTDNDGIGDVNDLDDDNDGILDTTEDTCTNPYETFGTTLPASVLPTANILVNSSEASIVNAVPPHVGGLWLAGNLDHTLGDVNGNMLLVTNLDTAKTIYSNTRTGLDIGKTYNFSAYLANPLIAGLVGPNITFYVKDASNITISSLNTGDIPSGAFVWKKYNISFVATTTTVKLEIVSNLVGSNNNLSGNDFVLDDISFSPLLCDLDQDGIPNSLDLDSDGDGCPDAIEGDENVQSLDLNPNGSINHLSSGLGTISGVSIGVPNLVNTGGSADVGSDIGQGIGTSQNVLINGCFCYKPPTIIGVTLATNLGITALGRAGAVFENWPMVRKGTWITLEAKTKGFVVNRLTDSQIQALPSSNLVEGMIVYNITKDCLQINTDGTVAGWKCFNTQTCPN